MTTRTVAVLRKVDTQAPPPTPGKIYFLGASSSPDRVFVTHYDAEHDFVSYVGTYQGERDEHPRITRLERVYFCDLVRQAEETVKAQCEHLREHPGMYAGQPALVERLTAWRLALIGGGDPEPFSADNPQFRCHLCGEDFYAETAPAVSPCCQGPFDQRWPLARLVGRLN